MTFVHTMRFIFANGKKDQMPEVKKQKIKFANSCYLLQKECLVAFCKKNLSMG